MDTGSGLWDVDDVDDEGTRQGVARERPMNYNLKKPCENCPFLADDSKAIRLSRSRAEEIGGMMLSSGGGDFICHKTSLTTSNAKEASHCAGALAFSLKHDNLTQMMRISERLGMFDPDEFLEIDPDTIIDEPEDMADKGYPTCPWCAKQPSDSEDWTACETEEVVFSEEKDTYECQCCGWTPADTKDEG